MTTELKSPIDIDAYAKAFVAIQKAKEKLNPIDYAIQIMKDNKFKTFIDTGEILVYNDGIYDKFGRQLIEQLATNMLIDKSTKHRKNEIVTLFNFFW